MRPHFGLLDMGHLRDPFASLDSSRHLAALMHTPKIPRRDPNLFYYKPERPNEPGSTISLECEQWRHGMEPEGFDALVVIDDAAEKVAGSIVFEIHAENLLDAVEMTIPVSIMVEHNATLEHAQKLVTARPIQSLLAKTRPGKGS